MFQHQSDNKKKSRVTTHSSDSSDIITTANESSAKRSDSYYSLFQFDRKENGDKARMTIADFILSCGLPFNIADHPKFRYMCDSMRNTTKKFLFPNRNSI